MVDYQAEGQLHAILVVGLGDPVVAAWIPPSDDQRWYIIPDGTDWDKILGWLVQKAVPEYVPGALRRARSPHFRDPDLQTTGELAARQALEEQESRHAEEKLHLEQALREAETHGEPVRYGLLYGTGAELVRAVAEVLTAAGRAARGPGGHLEPMNIDDPCRLTCARDCTLVISVELPGS